MELYLIRHGQSVNNALLEDQVLRVYDPELTEIGKQQAQHLAHFLATSLNIESMVTLPLNASERNSHYPYRITHLYCSAMHRALQTANPIAAALKVKPEIWLEIHEHGGIYVQQNGVITGYGGRTRSQIAGEFTEYIIPESITEEGWWNPANGMEDISLCQARAMRVAKTLRERAMSERTSNDRVALVTHGTFMDSLIKALLNMLPTPGYYHWHYNTAITRLDMLKDGRLVLRYVNRVNHLPPELLTT